MSDAPDLAARSTSDSGSAGRRPSCARRRPSATSRSAGPPCAAGAATGRRVRRPAGPARRAAAAAATRCSSRCSGSSGRPTRRPTCGCSSGPTTWPRRHHRGQKRKSGDPYITHPLAVATILAELGMTPPTLCAALLHDTVEDTPYTLDELRARLRRRDRAPGRRRHQARQGQVRRGGAGRDRAQDGRGDGPRHPGAGHQARRPAAQHAHHAVRQPRRPSGRPARRWRSSRRWPTGWA